MTLIYRPSNIYMTPNNVAVDMNENLQCSFVFNGYKLKKATYDLYNNLGSGKWNKIYSDMDMILTKTYYNNDVIEFTSFEDLANYYNSRCGWTVNVFGEEYNIVADTQTPTNSTFPLNVNGFESGDEVWLKNKYTRFFINDSFIVENHVSWVADGSAASVINNTIYMANDFNLTGNSPIQWRVPLIRDGDKREDSIIFYKDIWYKFDFTFYNYHANNPATDTEYHRNGIFNITPDYIVTLEEDDSTDIKRYSYMIKYNNDIKRGIVTTDYPLYFLVSPTIEGTIPLKNGSPMINIKMWDGVNVNDAYINYENKRVNFHGNREGALQNSSGDLIPYDWIGTDNTLSAHASSQVVPFTPFIPSVMKLEVPVILDVFNYKFKPTWEGTEPIISQWQAILFFEDGNIIEESPQIYNSNMEYVFFNQFLNGEKYYVHFHAYDNNGYYYHIQSNVFAIEYEVVDIKYNPIATSDCNDSSVNIKWDGIKIVNNDIIGNISYVEDYGTQDNYGLKLDANSSVGYNLDIPLITFPSFYWSPSDDTFDGEIMTMSNDDGGKLIVAYNSTNKKFEMHVTNITDVYVETIMEMNRDITINDIFLIGFYGNVAIPYVRLMPNTMVVQNESVVSE